MPHDEDASKTWEATKVTGLYRHIPSGRYYLRYSLKGRRTMKALKTSVFSIAAIKASAKQAEIAKSRATAYEPAKNLRTLADLAELYRARLAQADRSENTKKNIRNSLLRIAQHWPGDFRTAQPGNVDATKIIEFRTALMRASVKPPRWNKPRVGYRATTVNQTLIALKCLLDLAMEYHLIMSHPFNAKGVLTDGFYLGGATGRAPVLPSRWTMERLFAEVETVRNPHGLTANRVALLEAQAKNAAEFVRFLAYSGARLQDAQVACWEHIREDVITLWGTKTESALRSIPIFPQLRALLEDIRKRRVEQGLPLNGRILLTGGVLDPLKKACTRLGIAHMTQHHLRHYFATIAIESGVDIRTVAEWIGHKDRGVLLMKLYSHLRPEHSQQAAEKVDFRPKQAG